MPGTALASPRRKAAERSVTAHDLPTHDPPIEFQLRSVEHFAIRAAARARVSAWIEDYDQYRRYSAQGMMSPVGYEQALKAGKAA